MGEPVKETWRQLGGIETIPIPPEEEQRLRDAGRNMIGALRVVQRPPGPAKAHEFLVGQLVGQGAKTAAFRQALIDTFGLDEEGCLDEGERFEEVRRLVPDAFTITKDEVCIYEVEVTSPVTIEKLFAYAELWAVLDCDHTAFCRLFVINFNGDTREVDLPSVHLDRLLAEVDRHG